MSRTEWVNLPTEGPWVCPRRCVVREHDVIGNRLLVEWLEPDRRDVLRQILVYALTILGMTAAAVAWSVIQ